MLQVSVVASPCPSGPGLVLVEVHRQAGLHGLAVDRIIVAPEYVDRVLSAKASGIQKLEQLFMRKPAWVRHDEHLHLDFRLVSARKPG